jgi:hypothetical protein
MDARRRRKPFLTWARDHPYTGWYTAILVTGIFIMHILERFT